MSFQHCGMVLSELTRPSGPGWVAPGAGDPALVSAGCVVNISSSMIIGVWVWCTGWGAMIFRWGGTTDWQITNQDQDSLVIKHTAYRTPTISAQPTLTKQDAQALCIIVATESQNGTGKSLGNPNAAVSTGYGVYAAYPHTPLLSDRSSKAMQLRDLVGSLLMHLAGLLFTARA
jgi:hypothetical protein